MLRKSGVRPHPRDRGTTKTRSPSTVTTGLPEAKLSECDGQKGRGRGWRGTPDVLRLDLT